jgi:hypothetical protein
MPDQIEKYIDIPRTFPNKAGNLYRILTAQKRLLQQLGHQKGEVQALMLLVAEGYDATIEMLDWSKEKFNEVMLDHKNFREGAKIRDVIRDQSELIVELMNAKK